MDQFLGKELCVTPAYLGRKGEELVTLVVSLKDTPKHGTQYFFQQVVEGVTTPLTATLGTSQRCRWTFVDGVIQTSNGILRTGLDAPELTADGLVVGYTTSKKTACKGWDPNDRNNRHLYFQAVLNCLMRHASNQMARWKLASPVPTPGQHTPEQYSLALGAMTLVMGEAPFEDTTSDYTLVPVDGGIAMYDNDASTYLDADLEPTGNNHPGDAACFRLVQSKSGSVYVVNKANQRAKLTLDDAVQAKLNSLSDGPGCKDLIFDAKGRKDLTSLVKEDVQVAGLDEFSDKKRKDKKRQLSPSPVAEEVVSPVKQPVSPVEKGAAKKRSAENNVSELELEAALELQNDILHSMGELIKMHQKVTQSTQKWLKKAKKSTINQ